MVVGFIRRLSIIGAVAFLMHLSIGERAQGQETRSIAMFAYIHGLVSAAAPSDFGDYMLFTYQGTASTRAAGVSFAYERYQTIYSMSRNTNGVYFFLFPLENLEEANLEFLDYRYVVDGIWIADPYNDWSVDDRYGVVISRVAAPVSPIYTAAPIKHSDGSIEFFFWVDGDAMPRISSTQGVSIFFDRLDDLEVTVAGSFNGWDPFIHRLRADRRDPTRYSLRMRLAPGRHYYYFLIDGRRTLDPYNTDGAVDSSGRQVSVVTIDSR